MNKRIRDTIVRAEGLNIRRDKTLILKNVDWEIRRGEHWVILGGNGSGKTSLLSALTGYLMPTSGRIEVLGRVFGESDWRELRTEVGLVSSSIRQMMNDTEPALDTVASGKYAMIDFWGQPSRADRIQARSILKHVECSYLEDRVWAVLSQGERQRILIGRALMAKPSLLILDEPCAGLDPVAREHFLQFLIRLAKGPQPPSLVFVTHHAEEIVPLFTHVLLLRAGAVEKQGPRSKVMNATDLSRTFGAKVGLSRARGRYSLHVVGTKALPDSVM